MFIKCRDQCDKPGCCRPKATRRYCRQHASQLGVARIDAIENAEIGEETAVSVVLTMVELYAELPHLLRGKVVSALSKQWRLDQVRAEM